MPIERYRNSSIPKVNETTGEPIIEDSATRLVRELSRFPRSVYFCHGVAKRVTGSEVVLFCTIGTEAHAKEALADIQKQSKHPSDYRLTELNPGDEYTQRIQMRNERPNDIRRIHGSRGRPQGPVPDGIRCKK